VRAWKKSEWLGMLEEAGFIIETMVRFPKVHVFQDWCDRWGDRTPDLIAASDALSHSWVLHYP